VDDDIAFTRLFARGNLDIGIGGGHTLEVFQALLDIAQIEQVTGTGGQPPPWLLRRDGGVDDTYDQIIDPAQPGPPSGAPPPAFPPPPLGPLPPAPR